MILMVGASRQLGGMITQCLLARGEVVRLLVRDTPTSRALEALGAPRVTGDLKERASLDVACRGVDMVITTKRVQLGWHECRRQEGAGIADDEYHDNARPPAGRHYHPRT